MAYKSVTSVRVAEPASSEWDDQRALFRVIARECVEVLRGGDLEKLADVYEEHGERLENCRVKLKELPCEVYESEVVQCLVTGLRACPCCAFLLIHYVFTRNDVDIEFLWQGTDLKQAMAEMFTGENIEPILFVAKDVAERSRALRDEVMGVLSFEMFGMALSHGYEEAVMALLSAICRHGKLSDEVMPKIMSATYEVMKGATICNRKLIHPDLFVRCADVLHRLAPEYPDFTEWAVENEVDVFLGMMLQEKILKESSFSTQDTLPYTILVLMADIMMGESEYSPRFLISDVISITYPVEEGMRRDQIATNERVCAIVEEWLYRERAVELYHIMKNRHFMERMCDMCARGPFVLRLAVAKVWNALADRGLEEFQDLLKMRCLELASDFIESESDDAISCFLSLVERSVQWAERLPGEYRAMVLDQLSPSSISSLIELRDSGTMTGVAQDKINALLDFLGV